MDRQGHREQQGESIVTYTIGSVQPVRLGAINPDPTGIQPRGTLVSAKVEEYAQAYSDGVEMPHIELWYIDGSDKLRIIDGYHREAGLRSSKASPSIRALVKTGTMVQAKERAIKLNITHGISLTPHERETALFSVFRAITESGEKINDSELERSTGISRKTVRKYREKWEAATSGTAPTGSVDSFDIDDTPATTREPTEKVGTYPTERDEIPPFDDDESMPIAEAIVHDRKQGFSHLDQHLRDARRKIAELSEERGGEHLGRHKSSLTNMIESCLSAVRACVPSGVCPECDGKGDQSCPVCKGILVIVREQDRAIKEDEKVRKA